MRKSASQILRHLETRIARLEKSARLYKIDVEERVTPREDTGDGTEGKGPWSKEKKTVSELVEELRYLVYCYAEPDGKYYVLSGNGDDSHDLYQYRIEKGVFLDALVRAHFASVLDQWM